MIVVEAEDDMSGDCLFPFTLVTLFILSGLCRGCNIKCHCCVDIWNNFENIDRQDFFLLLYFYPQSMLDYKYMYVISTTIVYRDLTWGVVFQQTRSTLFYFRVKLFVMIICLSHQLVCSVWAVSVLVLLVWWVLVDLYVGVVCLCEQCCVS